VPLHRHALLEESHNSLALAMVQSSDGALPIDLFPRGVPWIAGLRRSSRQEYAINEMVPLPPALRCLRDSELVGAAIPRAVLVWKGAAFLFYFQQVHERSNW
jgi:hypothetical protein